MLEYYETLNIPSVPKSVVDSVVNGTTFPAVDVRPYVMKLKFNDGSAEYSAIYHSVELDQHCVDWLINCVPELADEKCVFKYQAIEAVPGTSGKLVAHTDGKIRGIYVLSYLLDTGSDQPVTTHWWQEHNYDKHRAQHTFVTDYRKLDQLTSIAIPAGQWHLLDASILHSVHGIKTKRTAITVGFSNKELVDLILSKYKFGLYGVDGCARAS